MKLKIVMLLCISCNLLHSRVFYPEKNKPQREFMSFNENIVELCKKNTFFRKEVITGPHSQVVLMNIAPGEDIGEEIHKVDQTLIFVQGKGQAIINNAISEISANHLIFVPAGTKHNFKNTGTNNLKLYTIYAPAQHKPGTVQKTKPKNGYE